MIALRLALVFLLFSTGMNRTVAKSEGSGQVEADAIAVKSISELLKKAELYHKKRISVNGYFVFGFEYVNLFETKDDFESDNIAKCITVGMGSVADEELIKFRNQYVKIVGVFDANLCKVSVCNYACRAEGITNFKIEKLNR